MNPDDHMTSEQTVFDHQCEQDTVFDLQGEQNAVLDLQGEQNAVLDLQGEQDAVSDHQSEHQLPESENVIIGHTSTELKDPGVYKIACERILSSLLGKNIKNIIGEEYNGGNGK